MEKTRKGKKRKVTALNCENLLTCISYHSVLYFATITSLLINHISFHSQKDLESDLNNGSFLTAFSGE